MSDPPRTSPAKDPRPTPRFSDIDAWGATHPGNVRADNQDHFLLGSLSRGVIVECTSLGEDVTGLWSSDRVATLAVVADGVASSGGGEQAARRAVEGLVSAVSRSFHDTARRESEDPEAFSRMLNAAALDVHESLLVEAEREDDGRRFATTVTLFLGLWPQAYLLQVGDSRCYVFRDGELSQITRDQTMAQDLIDSGALTRTVAERSRWAHILSSAMGGQQAVPVVSRVVRDWGTVVLLCSDGLTKHVSDERIRERLASMASARQVVEQLLQDALDEGGTDNVTLIVGRTLPPESGR